MIRAVSCALLVAAAVAAQAAPGHARALADYRAGRFQAAHEGFAALLAAQGDAAPPALRWNAALAALRVQRSGDAEAAIEPWRSSADAHERADGEFVFGLASVQRAERAAAAARLPDAEPMAWTMATQAMERAFASFVLAATLRGGWPEARRNAERAQRALAGLVRERDASRTPDKKQENPLPPEPPPPAATQEPEEAAPEPVVAALTPAEVAQLLQRLEQKDREKRTVRRAAARASTVAGERAW